MKALTSISSSTLSGYRKYKSPDFFSGKLVLVLGWVVLIFSSTLLIFQTRLHGDSLFLDSVMIDLFDNGGAWGDWKITPAPAYFPDMLAYALSYFFMPTAPLRIVTVCVIQAVLLALACINFANAVRPPHSMGRSALILAVISVFALVAANSRMWLFFNSTNNHFAALLFPILIGSLIFRLWDSPKSLNAFLIMFCVAVGAASTPVFSLAFTAPLMIFSLTIVMVLRHERIIRFFLIKLCSCILIGHAIALIVNKIVLSYDALEGKAPITVSAAQASLGHFANATKLTFGRENFFTLVLASVVTLAIIAVIFDALRNLSFILKKSERPSVFEILLEININNVKYRVALAFFMLALPTCVLGAIVSGGFDDIMGYRYFTFPLALGLLLFIIRFHEKSSKSNLIFDCVVFLFLSGTTVAGMLSSKNMLEKSGRDGIVDLFENGVGDPFNNIGVAACIKRVAGNGFEFHAGVGDFWHTRGLLNQTKIPSYILPVGSDLNPFFHMTTIGPLLNPEKYGIAYYNFLILGKPGSASPFDMRPETIGKWVPPPSEIIDCEDTDSILWLYDNRELDEFIQSKISFFLFQYGRTQKISFVGSQISGITGRAMATSRVADAVEDEAGYLSSGPYIKIPSGKYNITISYEATESGNKWDAGRFDNPQENITVAAEVLPIGQGSVSFDFEIKNEIDDFEIRVWYVGHGSLILHSISIERKQD